MAPPSPNSMSKEIPVISVKNSKEINTNDEQKLCF